MTLETRYEVFVQRKTTSHVATFDTLEEAEEFAKQNSGSKWWVDKVVRETVLQGAF